VVSVLEYLSEAGAKNDESFKDFPLRTAIFTTIATDLVKQFGPNFHLCAKSLDFNFLPFKTVFRMTEELSRALWWMLAQSPIFLYGKWQVLALSFNSNLTILHATLTNNSYSA